MKNIIETIKNAMNDCTTDLLELDIPDEISDNLKEVSSKIVGSNRWTVDKEKIYKINGKFICFSYDEPATECQEGRDTNPEVYEVEPYKLYVTKYRLIKLDL